MKLPHETRTCVLTHRRQKIPVEYTLFPMEAGRGSARALTVVSSANPLPAYGLLFEIRISAILVFASQVGSLQSLQISA